MSKLKNVSLSDQVAQSIVDYIVDHNLRVGDPIPTEKEIAEIFGIGKTSVREGVAKLKSLGVLRSQQGGRVILKEIGINTILKPDIHLSLYRLVHMSHQEVLDLIDLRRIIETAALTRALCQSGNRIFEKLESLYDQMVSSVNNLEQFINFDVAFHKAIIEESGNSVMSILFEIITELYQQQFHATALLGGSLEPALIAHKAILNAIRRENFEEATEFLDEHLKQTELQVLGHNHTNRRS